MYEFVIILTIASRSTLTSNCISHQNCREKKTNIICTSKRSIQDIPTNDGSKVLILFSSLMITCIKSSSLHFGLAWFGLVWFLMPCTEFSQFTIQECHTHYGCAQINAFVLTILLSVRLIRLTESTKIKFIMQFQQFFAFDVHAARQPLIQHNDDH